MLRSSLCLNGEWSFMPDYQGRSPEEAVEHCQWVERKIRVPSSWKWIIRREAPFQPYDLFGYPEEWNEAESGVIGRSFTIQRDYEERVFLILKGVLQRSCIYINGKKVRESHEAFLPMEIDITDHTKNGDDNDIKVWCGPYKTIPTETGKKILAPNGSWFAQMARGIWQDVYLEYRSPVYIHDIQIKTFTRRQHLEVGFHIKNKLRLCKGAIKIKIFDGSSVVKEAFTGEFTFEPGKATNLLLEESWTDAILWSPENPHLYALQAEIICNNETIDRIETRFGFREVWIEEHKFYLNGTRINLRGDAWHYQGFVQQNKEYAHNWYRACKDMGMNFVRLHAMPYPEFYLDAADEEGMLIIDESAIYGSSKTIRADHPEFIGNCRDHLRCLVLRDRNHPSVIIWSMQNEMRWVDGRDGYKEAMKGLIKAIKDLDDTRPVSFDGDNRLVEPEDMEMISMHYNIDGTVTGWQKDKPLIFGEHGKWHYISPQVCTALAGPDAYLSFDRCMEGIGLEERLFIEYARKEEVTGICPFNMCNYMVESMPKKDVPIIWEELSTPGVKPGVIKKYALTINNGYVKGEPLYHPNPSWEHVQAALKPVAVIPNEYNSSFFGGAEIIRSFSIYNDTGKTADARLTYHFVKNSDEYIFSGEEIFSHTPGERKDLGFSFILPDVGEIEVITFKAALYHDGSLVHTLHLEYKIYPRKYKDSPVTVCGKRIAYIGNSKSYRVLSRILHKLEWIEICAEDTINNVDLLIIGKGYKGKIEEHQSILENFVSGGGFLLVLEQSSFVPGEVTLSGKRFFSTFINDRHHPVFKGLNDEDLRFWDGGNIHEKDCSYLIQNAFNKPVQGDLKILLECGEGDFGWGGLLWTPMLEYSVGQGKVVLNQVDIIDHFDKVPQACLLLRNILAYGLEYSKKSRDKTGLITLPGSDCECFFNSIGLEYALVSSEDDMKDYMLLILDPNALNEQIASILQDCVKKGTRLVVLPAEPGHKAMLRALAGTEADIENAEVYQIKVNPHETTKGISTHDLYHFEKVTYSTDNKENVILCKDAICMAEGECLFESVKNPWYDYFIKGFDGEYMKIAIATMAEELEFNPKCYGLIKSIGKGSVLFTQIMLLKENDKVKRVYARLLGNIGASINTLLLSYNREEKDYGIEFFMALLYQAHYDYEKMEAYFSDRSYTLNNLGEGVYGWMKRLEKKDGYITIPDSAGKIYFLTVFIDSDINRDPLRRASNELPDSSIVPDLYINMNCSFKLFVNGYCYSDYANSNMECAELKIDDVVLEKGLNNMLLVCKGGKENARFSACFKNKYGDNVDGLKYYLTLD